MLGMLFLTDTMTITAQNVAVKTNVFIGQQQRLMHLLKHVCRQSGLLMFRRVTIRSHFLITKS